MGSAGHQAADAAERYAQSAGTRVAGAVGRAAHGLGELALRLGDRITEPPGQSRD